ncbi:amidohydrolase [Coprothermobacteraceae bacterium]|nr:amidohydrolase [Coprothermobacteraceae bacterium]
MRILITNAKINTVTQGIIERGSVLVENGKIVEVQQGTFSTEVDHIIDAKGLLLMPGFIDAHSHVGISEEGIGWEGEDYNEWVDPVTPQLRAVDGINPMEQGVRDALEGGVTTVCSAPGSANVIGGTVCVFKTHGTIIDKMIVKDPVAVKAATGENPKRVYQNQKKSPVTRMATAALMRQALLKARAYMEKKQKYADDPEKQPELDLGMEHLAMVLRGEIPLKVHAHRADDILTAIRIAKEFNIRITIDHCTEGHLIPSEIAESGFPCIVGPNMTSRSKVELMNRTFETPGVLYKHGVKVAIMTDHPVIPIQLLPLTVGMAVKYGLPYDEGIRSITINAAEILGLADRLGSIEVGKDADLVLWEGDPLTIEGKPKLVMVNGNIAVNKLM